MDAWIDRGDAAVVAIGSGGDDRGGLSAGPDLDAGREFDADGQSDDRTVLRGDRARAKPPR